MKKFMGAISSFLMIVMCFSISAGAVEEIPVTEPSSVDIETINVSDLENNPDVIVSEPMTFSETVEFYAECEGITYQEALKAFPDVPEPYSTNDVYRRVLTIPLSVNSSYKPALHLYCYTSEGGHFRNINSIYNVQLYREYNGISKQFSGDIQVWLRSSHVVEYLINGDFYNNGTTSVSLGLGGDINVGGTGKISLSASLANSTNHYDYFYTHAENRFAG